MTEEPQNEVEDTKPEPPKRPGIFLDQQQAQALVDYLKSKPYDEVAGFIRGLVQAPGVKL